MLLILSIVFALIPLSGIAWIAATKSITSVDGLFMSLILLAIAGIFLLNVALEMDSRGWLGFLHKSKTPPLKQPPTAKAG